MSAQVHIDLRLQSLSDRFSNLFGLELALKQAEETIRGNETAHSLYGADLKRFLESLAGQAVFVIPQDRDDVSHERLEVGKLCSGKRYSCTAKEYDVTCFLCGDEIVRD